MIKIDKKIVAWKLDKKNSETTLRNNNFQDNSSAPQRPKELPCEIHQVKIKGEAWSIVVGLLDGKPYEIFGGLSKFIEVPKKYKSGTLLKNGKVEGLATYNLSIGENDDKFIIKDIVNAFENTTQGAFTRLVSLSLRHRIPVNFVVEQLQKDQHSDITSFSKVIARVLKNYIPEGVKSTIQCNECKSNNMIFEAGCNRCLDCGYSKCL